VLLVVRGVAVSVVTVVTMGRVRDADVPVGAGVHSSAVLSGAARTGLVGHPRLLGAQGLAEDPTRCGQLSLEFVATPGGPSTKWVSPVSHRCGQRCALTDWRRRSGHARPF